MKTKLQILFIALAIQSSYNFLYGQDSIAKTRSVHAGLKLNPISFFVGTISASTEIFIHSSNSIQLGAQYWSGFLPIPRGNSFARLNGIFFSLRHYNNSNIRSSGYIEPFFRYNNLWEVNQVGIVNIYSVGFLFGKQWISKEDISFEFFVGPYYSKPIANGFDPQKDTRTVISKTVNETQGNPYNGLWIRAGIMVGKFF